MNEELEPILRAQYDGGYDTAREARQLLSATERLAADPAERQRLRNIVEAVDSEMSAKTGHRATARKRPSRVSSALLKRVWMFVIHGELDGGSQAARRGAQPKSSGASSESSSSKKVPVENFTSSAGIAAEVENARRLALDAMSAVRSQPDAFTLPDSTVSSRKRSHGLPLPAAGWRKKVKSVGDLLARSSGADMDTLAQVPEERTRFVQMAILLLATAGFSAASMIFALHDGLGLPSPLSVPLGLLFGIITFSLDRLIMPSLSAVRHRARQILVIVPRLVLAIVIGLLISTPLLLHVFANDINTQIRATEQEQSAQVTQLKATSHTQQEQLAAAEAQVALLQSQAQAEQRAVSSSRAAWLCELDGGGTGCQGSSGIAGDGPEAQQKQAVYRARLSAYDSIQSQLNAAEAELRTAEASSGQVEAQLASQVQENQAQLNRGSGTLAQLEVLSEISAKHPAVDTAQWAFLVFFVLIGLLPVTVRLAQTARPPSAYEMVAELKEHELIASLRGEREEIRRITEGRSQVRMRVEEDMRRREEDLGRRANEHIAAEMTKILETALQEWADQVRSKLTSSETGRPSADSASPPDAEATP